MNARSALALCGIGLVLLLTACGDSNDEATVASAPDRSAQEKRLEDRVRELRHQIEDEQIARENAAARKAEVTGSSGDPAVDAMLARLPGTSGLVVGVPGSGGPAMSGGDLTTGDAWSTIKVPIAERVLEDAGGPNQITTAQASEIHRAITLSDNDAAASLFAGLEDEHGGLQAATGAVNEMLLHAGDRETAVSAMGRDGFSSYGQTDWSLVNQFGYMAALAGGCISDPASRSYLLGQMSRVGGSDLFGLGAIGFPARWKGGWGPGIDGKYLVRQMGVMDLDGKEIVVAMAAIPDDGTFESGQAMLTRIANWIPTHLADDLLSPSGC